MLRVLARHGVDFVLIGGMAALALGASRNTYDLDIAYERSVENLERLAAALIELDSRLRGAPPDVPFVLDAEMLRRGLNFTFLTPFGSLDVLGEPAGAPPYMQLKTEATSVEIVGERVLLVSLDHLIAMKEAAGRPHDRLTANELRVISDELRAP